MGTSESQEEAWPPGLQFQPPGAEDVLTRKLERGRFYLVTSSHNSTVNFHWHVLSTLSLACSEYTFTGKYCHKPDPTDWGFSFPRPPGPNHWFPSTTKKYDRCLFHSKEHKACIIWLIISSSIFSGISNGHANNEDWSSDGAWWPKIWCIICSSTFPGPPESTSLCTKIGSGA